jgi:sulfate transport system ATP-binding protein
MVRVELERSDNLETMEAEITRDAAQVLELKVGETVFVRPRNMRLFTDDYQI